MQNMKWDGEGVTLKMKERQAHYDGEVIFGRSTQPRGDCVGLSPTLRCDPLVLFTIPYILSSLLLREMEYTMAMLINSSMAGHWLTDPRQSASLPGTYSYVSIPVIVSVSSILRCLQ